MGLIIDLCHFTWDRLPLNGVAEPHNGIPCLDEDWFVERAIEAGSPFVWRGRGKEQSHRLLYRYARAENIRKGYVFHDPHFLMLHQMVILFPTLFLAAAQFLPKVVEHDAPPV